MSSPEMDAAVSDLLDVVRSMGEQKRMAVMVIGSYTQTARDAAFARAVAELMIEKNLIGRAELERRHITHIRETTERLRSTHLPLLILPDRLS